MPDVRPINQDKYKISKHRFLELYHFCMQYREWKDELNSEKINRTAPEDALEGYAVGKSGLRKKCELIEQTAMEAAPEICQYIIKGVTAEHVTYKYLKEVMEIPCGKDMYYDRRRRFYQLLSCRI